MYTPNDKLFMLDPAKSGAAMHLNGGKSVVRDLIRADMKKHGLTIKQFAKKARVGVFIVGKLLRCQSAGIRLNKLHAIVRAAGGGDTRVVMRKIARMNTGPTPGNGKKGHAPKKLQQLISALAAEPSELAASFTIGEDRITVERLPGRESQPVVVEHGGHRLTIAKV
jgi:hypothetical protein